jgi:hypothetical protein
LKDVCACCDKPKKVCGGAYQFSAHKSKISCPQCHFAKQCCLFSDGVEAVVSKKSGKGKEKELPSIAGPSIHIPCPRPQRKNPVSDKASVASDESFCPGIERFNSVAIPRPPPVICKKSSHHMSDSSVEEVSGFNKCARVLSSGSMPQVTPGVLRSGDSYEAARELSVEAGRLMADAGRLMGEAEILRAKYEGMMSRLRLAEQ